MQPIRRYSGLVDAAIIFSDILVVPQAMGMEVIMNPGPHFPHPLRTLEDMEKLPKTVDVEKELGYVFKAITMTRRALNGEVPLIGFCGAPWTLFAYMAEGGGSKFHHESKAWLFKYPEESKKFIFRIADICIEYLVGQVKAGAQVSISLTTSWANSQHASQMLQVFDSNAGELSPHDFTVFSLPSLQYISAGVRAKLSSEGIPVVPMTLFAKGSNYALKDLAESAGYDVLGLDWLIEPSKAQSLVGSKVGLQGNFDPSILYGGKEAIDREVKRTCESFMKGGGVSKSWIANLGHGITPGVDPDDLKYFFECVHKYSKSQM